MANIVIAFESRYGQSHKIAEHIADRAEREGHAARLVHVRAATHANLDDADAFVVVAPVYFGQHPRDIRRFLRHYAGTLDRHPLAFVSVSNSAVQKGTDAFVQAEGIARRSVEGLHPIVTVCAAGALAYPRYGFIMRQMMRLIAKSTHGPTDTTRIHELTSWERLDQDCRPFFDELASREGATPSSIQRRPELAAV